MNEPLKRTKVAWVSPNEFPHAKDLSPEFELHRVNEPRATAPMDLAVVDVGSYDNAIEALKQAYVDTYLKLGIPILLIVDTTAQETIAFEWLATKHEICMRDATKGELTFRLRRTVPQPIEENRSTRLDPLTGLANRDGLQDYVAAFRAAGNIESPLCAISLELDRLKEINDKYGHRTGDHILAELGGLLQRLGLGAGIVVRLSGDEFVVIVPGNLEQGRTFAEFLRSQIELHSFVKNADHGISITCSAGVACATPQMPLEDLLWRADECLYAAKRAGRNRVITAEDFDALAEAAGGDPVATDLENRIRVTGERLTGELVLKARRLAGRFRNEADHDWLTGLFNRRHLDRVLTRALEKCRQKDRELSIALIDLDYFGEINKRHGFPTGDRALKAAAAAIRGSVRALDWVARYGGEEFCVVLPDTDINASSQVAERIRKKLSLENITSYAGQQFQVTGSIGVVQFSAVDINSEALIQRASEKVLEAKKNGRNQVRF